MRTVQLVLAAAIAAYASPAFAGPAIYHVNGDDGCPCDTPLPRVIYGVAPVPAPTPAYRVDQGPSFDEPLTGYAAPRVYSADPDDYPYVNGAAAGDDDASGGAGYAPGYGVYGFPSAYPKHRHRRIWKHDGRRDNAVRAPMRAPERAYAPAARAYVAPTRVGAPTAGPTSLTGTGGAAQARPAGALAGAPGAHVRPVRPMVAPAAARRR